MQNVLLIRWKRVGGGQIRQKKNKSKQETNDEQRVYKTIISDDMVDMVSQHIDDSHEEACACVRLSVMMSIRSGLCGRQR